MGSYLGQNFLKDSKIQHFIADTIKKFYVQQECDALIEIGPGKGALTKKIVTISENFLMIERDPQMIQKLVEFFGEEIKTNILESDILEVDDATVFSSKAGNKKTFVCGNLPYYITSPILRKFFGDGGQEFGGGVFLMQREVGEKISQDAGKKSFLRWLLNYAYEVRYLKTVAAKAFSPAPKVQSCVISILPKKNIEAVDFSKVYNFLDAVSGFKRKTLAKIGKILEKQQHPQAIPMHLGGKRLEELSRGDISEILNHTKL